MKSIGISLGDDYTDISLYQEEYTYRFPTLLCREKRGTEFSIGEEAYKKNLTGGVVLVDKLLSLFKKKGSATIEGQCYGAEELLSIFLRSLLTEGEKRIEGKELPEEEGKDTLVLTLREGEPELFKRLKELLEKLFGEEYSVQCISHTEAFAHYLLRQDKTLYNRLVGMFEFSNQVLHYYEMQVSKGAKKYAISAGEAQPEAISFDIMEKPQGKRMADQILSGLSDKITRGKVYSAFFLSGKGFESTDFAPGFMKKLLKGRRVCVESFLFAIGALEYAKLLGRGEEEEYLLLCETRVAYDVSLRVSQKEREFPYYLAKAGDAWLEKEEELLLLPDRQDYIDFTVQPFVGSKGRQLRMLLEGFPKREERCTKLSLKSRFVDASTILIRVEDKGLGDLHPASGMVIEERISLGKE